MIKYIIKRILQTIPVLIGVSIIVFVILRVFAPDPAPIVLGDHASAEATAAWREAYGLNEPIIMQYLHYMQGVLTGDFGDSYFTKTSVAQEIFSRFPATIELAVGAILFASIFGILFGTIAAVKKGTWIDNISMLFSLVGVAMPVFWLGLIMIIFFSGFLGLFPSTGRISSPLLRPDDITGLYIIDSILTGDMEALKDALWHLTLPAIVLGMYSMAIIARMTRSSLLEVLSQDYIRTAKAKGLNSKQIVMRHGLRNGLIPVITVIGLQFGTMLGGALLTESVFSWPGIGAYTVSCILKSDFPVVQGVVLLVATIFVTLNLLVDIIYAVVDPRIKYGKKEE